jgi:8-oxo-dGTP pyrophosphatase MutT (NUDIX family)
MNQSADSSIFEIIKQIIPRLIEKLRSTLIFAIIIVLLLIKFGSQVPDKSLYFIYAVALITLGAEFFLLYHESRKAGRDKLATVADSIQLPGEEAVSQPQPEERGRLHAGAVLYANVVKFSRFSTAEQDRVANVMLEWLYYLPLSSQSETYHQRCFWAKFGGGDLLCYIQNCGQIREYAVLKQAFFLCLDLLDYTASNNFQLGMTLHWADGCNFETCGSLVELWGNEIDKVHRLMTFSDGGHFFISDSAFKHLEGNLFQGREGPFQPIKEEGAREVSRLLHATRLSPATSDDAFKFDSLVIYDRHYRPHELVNFFVQGAEAECSIGNPSRPPDWVKIEHRDKRRPEDSDHFFVKHLVDADRASIVALTHEKTRHYLDTALEVRKGRFWERLDIIFPTERFLDQWVENDKSPETRKQNWEEGKWAVLRFLEATGPANTGRWKCCETDSNLTFWGNRLVKADVEIIRLAPLLPGPDLKDLRFVTFHQGIDGYQECSEAFDAMLAGSMSISEWELLGDAASNKFKYVGIANRSRLDQLSGSFCMPVMVVILYIKGMEGPKLVIQQRNRSNATDQHGSFSNISGRASVKDVSCDPEITTKYFKAIAKALGQIKSPDADLESEVATRAFNEVSELHRDDALFSGEEVWKRAALRELREELGLKLRDPGLIKHHCDRSMPDANKKHHFYFKIHSLEISRQELHEIQIRRPRAGLSQWTLADLEQHWKNQELNLLLQKYCKDTFMPILKDELHILEK